jgi:hypothetical protein
MTIYREVHSQETKGSTASQIIYALEEALHPQRKHFASHLARALAGLGTGMGCAGGSATFFPARMVAKLLKTSTKVTITIIAESAQTIPLPS